MEKIKNGTPEEKKEAQKELILSVQPFLTHFLNEKYYSIMTPDNKDDIRGHANLGIVEAIMTYDPVAYSFTTYIPFKIKEHVSNYLEFATGRSKHYNNLLYKIARVQRDAEMSGIELTTKEIAEKVGCSENQVITALNIKNFSTPVYLDSDEESDNIIKEYSESPEDIILKKEQSRIIHEAIHEGSLTFFESQCIVYKYGLINDNEKSLSISKIADKLNITPEEVQKNIVRATEKLKNNDKLKKLSRNNEFKKQMLNDKPIVKTSKDSANSLLETVESIFVDDEDFNEFTQIVESISDDTDVNV